MGNWMRLIFRVAFLATLVAVTWYSWLPSEKTPQVDMSDKVTHALAYGALCAIGMLAFTNGRHRLYLVPALVAWGAMVEFGQRLVPGRSFELADMAANALGVAAMYVLGRLLQRWSRGPRGQASYPAAADEEAG